MRKGAFGISSIAGYFLIFLTITNFCFGQDHRTFKEELEQIKNETTWRLGPFKIIPAVIFKDIGYDNNIYYQREEDNPRADFTATFSPRIKSSLVFYRSLILSLTVNPEYDFYFEHKKERNWNNALLPEFKFQIFNHYVLSGSYWKSTRRRRPSSEFDVRADELREGYKGSLFYETGWKTSFGFSALSQRISYDDSAVSEPEVYLSHALNREERAASTEFYYRLFSESDFFVHAGFTEYKFEYHESRWRDSQSFQIYSGLRFPLSGKIRGTLSLGYKRLIPGVDVKQGYAGLVGDTSLDFRLKRLRFRLNFNRDCHFSYWTNNVFFIEDKYGAGASFYITRFLRIDYNVYGGYARYPELTEIRLPDGSYGLQKRKDSHLIHSVGLAFKIIKNTGIGIVGNLWRRESNFFLENRERIFVGGYITYDF